jgi:hypothetical protein
MMSIYPQCGRWFFLLLFTAWCGTTVFSFADTPPDLVGTWEYATPAGSTLSITLEKDGSAKMDAAPLKYKVEGNKLSMIDGSAVTTYQFTFAGDTLKLSGGDLEHEVSFQRKGGAKRGLLGGKIKALDQPASSNPKSADATKAPASSPTKESPLAGTWELTTTDGSIRIIFAADGTGSLNGVPLKYTYASGKLDTTLRDTLLHYNAVVSDKTLQLTVADKPNQPTVTFNRVAADAVAAQAPAGARAVPGSIQGTWKANDGSILQFTADALLYNGNRLSYKATDTLIRVNDGAVEWQYQLNGDTLKLSIGQEVQTLTRIATAAGEAPASRVNRGDAPKGDGSYIGSWESSAGTLTLRADGTGSLDGKEGRYTMQNGKLRLEGDGKWVEMPAKMDGDSLVIGENPSQKLQRAGVAGVWVGSEADVDPTNAMVITQYLVLYSDGGVGFSKTELGASRQQVSDLLERFHSFRNNSGAARKIYGHWESDGKSITIQWKNMRNNARCEGTVDLSKMKMKLPAVGILHEGEAMEFERK